MPTFAVDINTYFTVEGESKKQVEEYVLANFFTADIEPDNLSAIKNDYGIEIVECNA